MLPLYPYETNRRGRIMKVRFSLRFFSGAFSMIDILNMKKFWFKGDPVSKR